MTATKLEVFPSRIAVKEYSTNLLTNLWSLRNRKTLTDVVLVCEGGKELRAHSMVLSAASAYFSDEGKDMGTDRYDFRTLAAADMEVMLEFMYLGKIQDEEGIKKDLDRLAAMQEMALFLKLESLSKWCLHRLAQTIEFYNYLEMYELAVESSCEALICRIVTFVVQNFIELLLTKQIPDLPSDLMLRALQHPEIVLVPPDTVVRAILQWVEHDSNRKNFLAVMIQILDLSYLPKDLLSTLLGNRLVKNDRHVITVLMAESTRRAMVGVPDIDVSQGQQLVCFGKKDQKKVVRIYDIESNTWSPARSPPFAVELGMTIVGYGHQLYLFGSCGWPPCPTTLVMKYNPVTNIVSESEGSLISPVCRAGAVVIDDVIYVINGFDETKQRVNVVQCYRPKDGLSVLCSPTLTSHVCPQGFAFNNCVYIVGSLSDDEKSLESYDPLSDQWTFVARIPGTIYWCRVAMCDDKLCVLRKKEETRLQVYDLVLKEWSSRQFESLGPKKTDWGIWAAQKGGSLILLVRDGENVLYTYDVATEQWGAQSEPNRNPWHYKLSCVIWK